MHNFKPALLSPPPSLLSNTRPPARRSSRRVFYNPQAAAQDLHFYTPSVDRLELGWVQRRMIIDAAAKGAGSACLYDPTQQGPVHEKLKARAGYFEKEKGKRIDLFPSAMVCM